MPNRPNQVFLDANVLIQEGKTGSPILERLVDLVDIGLIAILTTDLTMTEVAKKHTENDINIVKDFTRPHFRAILSDALGEKLPEINKTKLKELLSIKYIKSTKKIFNSLKAKILTIDDVSPSTIFGSYSRREGFFSGEGKKDQFPDAFIFECLRKISNADSPIIIVSSDGDFVAPSKLAENISLVKSVAELFSTLGLEMEVPEVEDFFSNEHGKLISSFNTELSQWGLMVSDVMDAGIDDATVTDVKLENFTAFQTLQNDRNILVAGDATVTAEISYTHPDWDTASWDSEDKVAIPWDHVSGEKEITFEVPFSMTLSVDKSGKPVEVNNLSFLDDSFSYVALQPYETYK